MRKATPIILAATGSLLLTGCTGGGIFNRERPDEFAVQRQTPLVVPPDFHLVPPEPGAPRPTEGTAAQQALDVLFGGESPRSDVERRTIFEAGESDPGIRSSVGDVETHTVDKGQTTRALLSAPEGDGQDARVVIPG